MTAFLPRLLVAIPTFNRSHIVEIAVKSLMSQANRGERWSVLVIDNASTDDTFSCIQGLAKTWPKLKVLQESIPGSARARNRAIEECEDAYILFTDDECIFPDNYVDKALEIIDQRRPMIFGGPVLPWYREPPPSWFLDEYGSYSLPHATGRASHISLSGANIGFATEALKTVGGFDSSLGIHGASLGFGEETDLELRILRRYGKNAIWFDPDFINKHLVLPSKYSWSELFAAHFKRGLARAEIQTSAPIFEGSDIPECLKPSPRPETQPAHPVRWQNILYTHGLGAVRKSGYLFGRIRKRLRKTIGDD